MVIDAHVHIMPQRKLDGISIWLGRVVPYHPLAGTKLTADSLIKELLGAGTEYWFNFVYPMKPSETEELNLFNFDFGNRLKPVIPFGSLHVENDDKKAIVEKCVKEYGFVGFKFHTYVQGFSPDDERMFPAYEAMEEFGSLINIHTGFDDSYPQKVKPITLSTIEGLVKRFSSLTFLVPHMFYPQLSDAVYLMETYGNVYTDTTNVFGSIVQDEERRGINRDKEREVLMNTLDKWSKRMVFGTDHPAGMSDLNTIYEEYASFDLAENIKRDIQYNTAHDLLTGIGGLEL